MKRKIGVILGALALTTTTAVTESAPAAAADLFTFSVGRSVPGVTAILVFNESKQREAGQSEWWQDPSGSYTGDTLVASDQLADGYGIEAHLSTGRVATTRGQNSPYVARVTGNLPEDRKYQMRVCVVKGSWSKCSAKVDVSS
ncbi:hypothetical protein ACQPZG_05020 (plasmid) [Streptomyces sp. CA-294286]|uniref:hypothetical protein n=1 Tax=Streptomyces sp. CA-294286 TaxID=3240070 RepID=UPI003D945BFE